MPKQFHTISNSSRTLKKKRKRKKLPDFWFWNIHARVHAATSLHSDIQSFSLRVSCTRICYISEVDVHFWIQMMLVRATAWENQIRQKRFLLGTRLLNIKTYRSLYVLFYFLSWPKNFFHVLAFCSHYFTWHFFSIHFGLRFLQSLILSTNWVTMTSYRSSSQLKWPDRTECILCSLALSFHCTGYILFTIFIDGTWMESSRNHLLLCCECHSPLRRGSSLMLSHEKKQKK